MSLPWILSVPASRGLGAAFAGHLLATTKAPVVATARSDLNGARKRILGALEEKHGMTDAKARKEAEDRLEVLEVDVTQEDSIRAAAEHCKQRFPSKEHHLHLGLLIPGVLFPEKSPSAISAPDVIKTLHVNLLGPMLLAKHFIPFLPRRGTTLPGAADFAGLPAAATLALMSARVGSITDNGRGGWYSYRSTKAGVTQLAKSLDHFLLAQSGDSARAVALHPGTVRTDLSKPFWDSQADSANGGKGLFEPAMAARQLVDVLNGIEAEGRGGFFDWKGEVIPP